MTHSRRIVQIMTKSLALRKSGAIYEKALHTSRGFDIFQFNRLLENNLFQTIL